MRLTEQLGGTGVAGNGIGALTEKDVLQLEVSMDNLQQAVGSFAKLWMHQGAAKTETTGQ